MATAHFSRAVSTACVNAINSAINGGAGAGTISFYTGTMPADTTVGIGAHTLLGTCTCSDPAGVESGGTLTFSAITQDSSADNTGVATWVRIRDSSGTVVMDLDVTAVGGGGYVQMASTSITATGPIAFSSFTITMP
jgi:hypothetical protein